MQVIKHLDLFSGIGGFALGLAAAEGFETKAFCDINPFCRKVLEKHWPRVPIYQDIKTVYKNPNSVDIITGGFPCQDVSVAAKGNQESILGPTSGLWIEFYRIISSILPTWVIIENVENLRNKGLNTILWQLATVGYDAEWLRIRAADVGLPHIRSRLWIIAHRTCKRLEGNSPFPLQWLRRIPWGTYGREASEWTLRGHLSPSPLLRAGHGIPDYVDRITAIGNSLVPEIVYHLGCAILHYEKGNYEQQG